MTATPASGEADRPRWADEFATLAAVAADLHAQRALHYPKHVAKGTLSLADADAGIRIMAAIAADWRRALDRKPIPASIEPATREERIETLAVAADRHRARIDKAYAEMREAFMNMNSAPLPDASVAELRLLVDMGMPTVPELERYCIQVEYGECIETLLWWERQPFGIAAVTDFNIAARLRWPMQPIGQAA